MARDKIQKVSRQCSYYITHAAFYIGLWFILEYFVTVLASRNIYWNLLRTPMMLITPIIIFYHLHRLRKIAVGTFCNLGIFTFMFAIQLMTFAGILEAGCIAIYNQWINPENLYEMQHGMIVQYEELIANIANDPASTAAYAVIKEPTEAMINELKNAPIQSPFNASVSLFSSDLTCGFFWGLIFAFFMRRKPSESYIDIMNNDNN